MKSWKKCFPFNVQKISLRRGFDISKMKNYENTRKKLFRAMFYFECCLVQRDFFSLDEMCYDENVVILSDWKWEFTNR